MSDQVLKIAVSTANYAADRLYDYRAPAEDGVLAGMRVIVPFGKGNRKCEGVVVAVTDVTPSARTKPLFRIIDSAPVLTEADIRLALWMRQRCFCTVYDAVKCILPAGFWYQLTVAYSLCPDASDFAIETISSEDTVYADTVAFLREKGETTEDELYAFLRGRSPAAVIERLTDAGIVVATSNVTENVRDKLRGMVALDISKEDAQKLVDQLRPRSPVQSDALRMIAEFGEISRKELAYFTGANAQTVRSLEKKGLVRSFATEVFRESVTLGDATLDPSAIELTDEQTDAFNALRASYLTHTGSASLLYGVTGSGKTSVYIKLISEVLRDGRGAIVLVPEISLTPQLLQIFGAYFGKRLAVLHSGLSVGERFDAWKRIRRGMVDVVIGARSAVFAPLPNLGLVILDEEHEASYKSENNPKYHARDVAKFRCVENGALLVLGSATPSVESMYCATEGGYHLLRLRKRYNQRSLPNIIISDMRQELKNGNGTAIGQALRKELASNIERGEQSILLINRRGSTRHLYCEDCGEGFQCEHCSASLVYHSANGRLMCHYCGYSMPLPNSCPHCGGRLRHGGIGTQRLEAEIAELFPGVETLRMDADTTSKKNSHEAILRKFRVDRVPILIGTQMVAKGLDIENVTLVGVISADDTLYLDDYRASERTFSLITQVVGRAGRGSLEGRAVIQTMSPKNPVILCAAEQDYDCFYQTEIELRRIRNCPPFSDFFTFSLHGEQEELVIKAALRLVARLNWSIENGYGDVAGRIIGPSPEFIVKVNNKFRYRVVFVTASNRRSRELASRILIDFNKTPESRFVTLACDINPGEF